MRAFVYRHSKGHTEILRPQREARLCYIGTVEEGVERETQPFYVRVRAAGLTSRLYDYQVAVLQPEWAETEDEFYRRIENKDIPIGATEIREIDDSEVPQDRTFRDALEPDLTHHMGKAADIARSRVREARKSKMSVLDIDVLRALENANTFKEFKDAIGDIVKRKKAMRDATDDPRIAAAKTVEELAAIDPLEGL